MFYACPKESRKPENKKALEDMIELCESKEKEKRMIASQTDEMIKVIVNGEEKIWPKAEYLDYVSYQYGFEDYEDLKRHGYQLNISSKETSLKNIIQL